MSQTESMGRPQAGKSWWVMWNQGQDMGKLLSSRGHIFPGGSTVKNLSAKSTGDKRTGFNPWVGKAPKEGNSNPFQYSCLENFMDRGAWRSLVHRAAKSQTLLKQLSMHVCYFLIINRLIINHWLRNIMKFIISLLAWTTKERFNSLGIMCVRRCSRIKG